MPTAVLVCTGPLDSSSIAVLQLLPAPAPQGEAQLSSHQCKQGSATGFPPLHEQQLSQVSNLRIPQTLEEKAGKSANGCALL